LPVRSRQIVLFGILYKRILYFPPGVRPRPWRQQQCSVRRARFAPHRGLPMPWGSGPRGRPGERRRVL